MFILVVKIIIFYNHEMVTGCAGLAVFLFCQFRTRYSALFLGNDMPARTVLSSALFQ